MPWSTSLFSGGPFLFVEYFPISSFATNHYNALNGKYNLHTQVSTNAFAVSSLRCSEPSVGRHVRPMTHTKVAVALYLAAAMFNHCCAPNALVTFHGGEMRVVATRVIEDGEPVTISYGPLLSKVKMAAVLNSSSHEHRRQQWLCRGCIPLNAQIKRDGSYYVLPSQRLPHVNCRLLAGSSVAPAARVAAHFSKSARLWPPSRKSLE